MKRWRGVLVIALYLLILSLLFVPLSHVSLAQFANGLLIRSAIVVGSSSVGRKNYRYALSVDYSFGLFGLPGPLVVAQTRLESA